LVIEEELTSMHLVVCLKQILDPEIPPSDFRLGSSGHGPAEGIAALVPSIFDENALEVALQVRESVGTAKITAVSIGPDAAIDVLRKALSMRADEGILVQQSELPPLDTFGTARILASVIRKLEPPDLVLCGRESGDWYGGQVGAFLAAELNRPFTALVASAKKTGEHWELRRQADDGWETIACKGPAVISVTNDEHNLPRIPKVRDNMMAFKKQVPIWTARDLGIDPSGVNGPNAELQLEKLFIPQVSRHCEMITGENADSKAAKLLEKMAVMHVI
jgi:electron transfer flavoprotein beta subunit